MQREKADRVLPYEGTDHEHGFDVGDIGDVRFVQPEPAR